MAKESGKKINIDEADKRRMAEKVAKKSWLLEPKENPYFTVEYRRFFDEGALAQAKKIAEKIKKENPDMWRKYNTYWQSLIVEIVDVTADCTKCKANTQKDYKDCLDAARSACFDAIYHEDGLDGDCGEAVIKWITDLLGDKETWLDAIKDVVDKEGFPGGKALDKLITNIRQQVVEEIESHLAPHYQEGEKGKFIINGWFLSDEVWQQFKGGK